MRCLTLLHKGYTGSDKKFTRLHKGYTCDVLKGRTKAALLMLQGCTQLLAPQLLAQL